MRKSFHEKSLGKLIKMSLLLTMWKYQGFVATHILREINFSHFEDLKTAILTILAALNFRFLGVFNISKSI